MTLSKFGSAFVLFALLTISQAFGQTLSGTYTIDPLGSGSRNFTSFQIAADSLASQGISSSTTFEVAAGTYAGPIRFKKVPGASATNTVRFTSPHVDSVQISVNGVEVGITLDNADHYYLEQLDINDLQGRGIGILFTNGADSNTLHGCRLQVSGNLDIATHIVMGSIDKGTLLGANSGNGNLIRNCQMIEGSIGLRLLGDTVNHCSGNMLVGNTISTTQSGIVVKHQDQLLIDSNVVNSTGQSLEQSLLAEQCNSLLVEYNSLLSGGVSFKNVSHRSGSTYGPSRAVNNMCYLNAAFSLAQCEDFIIWHNTLYSNESSSLLLEDAKNLDIRNNIIFYDGAEYAFVVDSHSSFSYCDYNNFWSTQGHIAFIEGKRYSTTTALMSYKPALNQHNWSQNPDLVSLSRKDLRIGSNFPSLFAPYLGINKDIDGEVRCNIRATIGCDEAAHSIFSPRANFGVADTLWQGSIGVAFNGVSPNAASRVYWFVNGKFITDSFHMEYVPTRLGYDTISLRIETCSGNDTLSKRVFVQKSLSKPKADFLSSSPKTLIGETVSLIDLSSNGPNQWAWNVYPETAYNYRTRQIEPTFTWEFKKSSTKAYPKLVFLMPGAYNVQLTVANANGQDSLVKKKLIEVIDQLEMCGQTLSTANEGILLDDGGLRGYYDYPPAGMSDLCTATISTCEGILEFDMKAFKLGARTYLRIYDGLDTNGTPLWNIKESPRGMQRDSTHPSVVKQFKALSGNAYIEFEKDAYASIDIGFEIHWQVKRTFKPLPNASFEATDTACTGYSTSFQNTSSGNYSKVAWDLDADGSIESNDWNFAHEFKSPGTRKVALYVYSNCALTDTFVKELVIENGTRSPRPVMHASTQALEVYDTVYLSANSPYCYQSTLWSISPANYQLLDGGQLSDEYIALVFTKGGEYDVSLTMENAIGSATTLKKNYIRVVDYCIPTVSTLSRSVAITEVRLADYTHLSDAGKNTYSYTDKRPMLLRTGHAYPIEIHRKDTTAKMSRNVWIDWNFDGDFDDRDELVASEGPAHTLAFKDSLKVPYHVKSTTTRMRVAVNFGTLRNISCGPHQMGEFEDYNITINDSDIRAPKLTLLGLIRDTIAVNSNWTEPGFKARDERWGNVNAQVQITGKVYAKGVGSYALHYEVSDSAGNVARAVRTIVVIDSIAPMLSLIGPDSTTLQAGLSFLDQGTIASDNYDTQFKIARAGKLDSAKLGSYILRYCLTDSSGNGPVCITRLVHVIDTVSPILQLEGDSQVVIDVFSTYKDPGYTVTDGTAYTVSLSGNWTGKVDSLGIFTQVYTAIDAAGNQHSATRQIEVVDRVAPAIALLGDLVVNVGRRSTYQDLGVTVSDNYFAASELRVDTAGSFENTDSEGIFTITYTATDPKGNVSGTVQRLILVNYIGIDSDDRDLRLQAYPNPTTGLLHIGMASTQQSDVTLTLYNDLGQEVLRSYRANGLPTQLLDLSGLPTGLYLLEVQTDEYRQSQLIQKN